MIEPRIEKRVIGSTNTQGLGPDLYVTITPSAFQWIHLITNEALRTIWYPGFPTTTPNFPNSYLELQPDGNLVNYYQPGDGSNSFMTGRLAEQEQRNAIPPGALVINVSGTLGQTGNKSISNHDTKTYAVRNPNQLVILKPGESTSLQHEGGLSIAPKNYNFKEGRGDALPIVVYGPDVHEIILK